MPEYTAKIYDIDFYGNAVGDPIQIVSGEYESEDAALKKINDDFFYNGQHNGNYKIELG